MDEEEDNYEIYYPPYRKDVDNFEYNFKLEFWMLYYRFEQEYKFSKSMMLGLLEEMKHDINADEY